MFDIRPTRITGCVEMLATKRADPRGFFVKTFHHSYFEEHGLATNFKEQYYSKSNEKCLRGLHFQMPPHDHEKLVYCISGEVLDVIVDLRVGSPTYGQFTSVVLSAETCNQIYISKGLAHGFYVLSKEAIMVYNVTSEYAPNHDTGIHWESIGMEWPIKNPMISERDDKFEHLENFQSPFTFVA